MYQHILVAIEHSPADQTILAHVQPLARLTHARLLLLHVADGWAARAYDELQLRESEEMRQDRDYLEDVAQPACERRASTPTGGSGAATRRREIIATARREHVDLVAMATHGHRLLRRSAARHHGEPRASRARVPGAAAAERPVRAWPTPLAANWPDAVDQPVDLVLGRVAGAAGAHEALRARPRRSTTVVA